MQLSADDEEIVVDWSSGTAKSNISNCTDAFVNNVVEKAGQSFELENRQMN